MSPGGAEQGYSRRAALPTSVVMGSGLLLLIVLMKGLFIASGASMKPLESILTRYSHIEDDSSSGEGDDDGSAFFNPFTNVDAFDPLFSDEPDQTVRAAKRLNSFAHKAPRGMRVPDACTATLDGRRVEPGSPPLFDRLLLVTVDTRIRRTKLDHNGNCDLVWRTFAYKSTRLLVIGDEDTVGVLPLNKDRFHYTSKELMLADFLSKEAGALGPGGLQGDDAARTLVVFLDGGDVFMQGTPEDLIDCFNRMWCERGYDARDDVLILGERGIHPWHPGRYNTWNYDQSKDYPFINSGVYGGSWAAVHRMLVGTVAQIAEDAWNDDQAALHVLRLDKKDVYGKNMRLDNGCQQCFGSAYGNEPDPNAGPNGYVLDTSLGRMVHNKNKEPPGSDREGQGCSPVLMHMNGIPPKKAMPDIIRALPDYLPWGDPRMIGGRIWLYDNKSLATSPPDWDMSDPALCGAGAISAASTATRTRDPTPSLSVSPAPPTGSSTASNSVAPTPTPSGSAAATPTPLAAAPAEVAGEGGEFTSVTADNNRRRARVRRAL